MLGPKADHKCQTLPVARIGYNLLNRTIQCLDHRENHAASSSEKRIIVCQRLLRPKKSAHEDDSRHTDVSQRFARNTPGGTTDVSYVLKQG